MRILHLLPALESGGVETGTVDLAISLKKLGQSIVVISKGGRLVKDLERNGILHIKLPIHKKSPFTLLLVSQVASLIKEHHIEVVHASSRVPAWIGFFACKLTKTPFVTSCHGFYSKHIFSRVMSWGRLVMVISKSIEKKMVEDFNVPKERLRLVYRGVDLAKYPYNPEKYDKKKNSFTVINIGRLTPLKGHYEFIKAMKLVVDRVRNVKAQIVGEPEKGKERYLDKLKKLARELKIEKSIEFLGLRSDIKDLLKNADCLVLSTDVQEGFGRTLIEAGATGTACCASNVGGIREIIDDGVTGLLFTPGSDVQMAEAIVRMLRNPALCKRCAENLRKKIETHFTLERMSRQTLAVYEEALKN